MSRISFCAAFNRFAIVSCAFALQSRGRNCSPAPRLALGKLLCPHLLFSGVVVFSQTPVIIIIRIRTKVNPQTKHLGFRGFGSVRLLILRGGIPRSMGDFPES